MNAKRFYIPLALMLALGMLLSACGSPYPDEVTDLPLGPQEYDDIKYRSEVNIDAAQILILESYPVQVRLTVQGNTHNACYSLRAVVNDPDPENRILVEMYTMVPPDVGCVRVPEPFNVSIAIDMEGQPNGDYSVWLNDEWVGEFSYPG